MSPATNITNLIDTFIHPLEKVKVLIANFIALPELNSQMFGIIPTPTLSIFQTRITLVEFLNIQSVPLYMRNGSCQN